MRAITITKMSFFILTAFLVAGQIHAQSQTQGRNPFEVKGILGGAAFLDEDIPLDHFIIGGAVGFWLTERLAVQPQFEYMSGPGNDRDYALTGNLLYHFGEPRRLWFYTVVGGGLMHHRDRFNANSFSSNEFTVNGGLGVKIFLSEKMYVAPEFRIGYEPLFLPSVGIGFKF